MVLYLISKEIQKIDEPNNVLIKKVKTKEIISTEKSMKERVIKFCKKVINEIYYCWNKIDIVDIIEWLVS